MVSLTSSYWCPECGGRVLKDPHTDEYYCEKCGLIVGTRIDPGREWNVLKEERSRTGPPLTYLFNDYGLSSPRIVVTTNTNNNLKGVIRRRKRLNADRLYALLMDLSTCASLVSSVVNIPREVKERAAYIIHKAHNLKLRMRNEHLVVAALYIAIKEAQIPISLREYCKTLGKRPGDVFKACKKLCEALNITWKLGDPFSYIYVALNRLNSDQDVRRVAIAIVSQVAYKICLSPVSLAAGVLYIAFKECNRKVTQREIAQALGVSEFTVRRVSNLIRKMLEDGNLHEKATVACECSG